jgi:hypothetical protein
MNKRKGNNHFISEFQLKKFLCVRPENRSGKFFTFLYSRDKEPEAINIKHAGSAFHFFGSADDVLENAFAVQESRFGQMYKEIIEQPGSVSKYSDLLSDLFWLFSFRTRAMRERIRTSFASVFETAAVQAYEENARAHFEKGLQERFNERLEEILANLNAFERLRLQSNPNFVEEISHMREMIKSLVNDGHVSDFMASGFRNVRELSKSTQLLDEGHNDILAEFLATGGKCPKKLRKKSWRFVLSKAGSFVLGDSGAFARNELGEIEPFVGVGSESKEAYLPISPHLTVVGLSNLDAPSLSEGDIIKGAISTSYEHFFADQCLEELQTLARSELGRKTGIVPQSAIENIVTSAWTPQPKK